jgi:hypothetical protein
MASVVQPQLDRATAEANAEADRQVQRQQAADAQAARDAELAGRREDRAGRQEDRLATAQDRQATVAEDTLAFNREKESYSHGRDAVGDALALMKYRVDPSFSPSLAGIYNQIVPGAFQPGAFQFDLPDTDAIAASHVDGLLAMHGNTAAPRVAPAGMPGAAPTTMPQTAIQAQTPVDPLAGVPVAPRVPDPANPNRDEWWRR